MHTHGHSFADKTYDSFYSCQMRITTDKKRKRKDDNWSLSSSVSFNGLLFSLSLSLRLKMWASIYLWPISFHARIRKKNETFSFFFPPPPPRSGDLTLSNCWLILSRTYFSRSYKKENRKFTYYCRTLKRQTNKRTNEQNKKLSSTRNYLVDKLDTTNSL